MAKTALQRRAILLALAMATGSVPAFAQGVPAKGATVAKAAIEVKGWARAPIGDGPMALYLTLHNAGPPDVLTSVATDAAGMAMLHQSVEQNGAATMRGLASIDLPADGTVAMRPGGLHVMLVDLNRPLHAGDTLHATLTFAHAPPQTVPVPVLPPGAPAPP